MSGEMGVWTVAGILVVVLLVVVINNLSKKIVQRCYEVKS